MKTWKVFFDIHKWAPHDLKIKEEFGLNVFYGGDNHEMKNIPREDIAHHIDKYKKFLIHCVYSRTKVISGNHECSVGSQFCKNNYFIDEKVLFVHGDILSYSEKKFKRWRNKTPGVNSFKLFIAKFFNNFIRIKSAKISKAKIKKGIELMDKYECSTIVFGHTHPKKIIDITTIANGKEYRFVNCPRGKSLIKV